MPKKRRGRPPKSKLSTQDTNIKHNDSYMRSEEDVGYDINLRRESYNSFSINNEPTFATVLFGQNQLQVVNKDISYSESLLKFSKDLGPTARKVAHRMLQRQSPTSYQARHLTEPMLSPPEPQQHPSFVVLNSMDLSLGYTSNTNQSNQPLVKFRDSSTDFIANYKGKNIMVDNGQAEGNKWDAFDDLEFLYGKQKGGIKIGNSSSDNKDFVYKNVGYGQIHNQSYTNPARSFFSNYNKISGGENEDIWQPSEVTPRIAKPNSLVYPSTYVQPSKKVFSPLRGLNGEGSSSPWIQLPSMDEPSPMQTLQNWYPPPFETNNQVVNNDYLNEQELQLALALNMEMTTDQESNIWAQNLWEPSLQPNQFLQPDQVLPLQDQVLMPTLTQNWSHMAKLGANPEQYYSLPFGTHQDFGFQMGNNNLQYPPPGF